MKVLIKNLKTEKNYIVPINNYYHFIARELKVNGHSEEYVAEVSERTLSNDLDVWNDDFDVEIYNGSHVKAYKVLSMWGLYKDKNENKYLYRRIGKELPELPKSKWGSAEHFGWIEL